VRVWVGIAVAMVLLVSACGSSGSSSSSDRLSPSEYRAQLKTLAKESDTAQHKLETVLTPEFQSKTSAQLAKVLDTFAADEKRIGDEVAALKPPKNAEAANSEMAKGFHDTSSEVRAVIPHIERLPAASAGIAYLHKQPPTTGGRELDAALAKLKKLGYIQNVS
jgi:hypothetical protein